MVSRRERDGFRLDYEQAVSVLPVNHQAGVETIRHVAISVHVATDLRIVCLPLKTTN